MSTKILNARTQLRNDTAANWVTEEPVLAKGEMGIEIDTAKFKIGDGIKTWSELGYSGVLVTASTINGNIVIDGVESVVYVLPTATATILGGVKSQAEGINKVTVATDGTMGVKAVTTASQLATARTITIAGDATGSTGFDGSANKSIVIALTATGVVAGSYTKVTVDTKGRVTKGESLSASDVPTLTLAKISDAGTAAKLNAGKASGNVPVLDSNGKLSDDVIPSLAIGNVFEASSEAEMLALTGAETGDICVRSDTNTTFILKATPSSTLANWVELKTPTDLVQSVNSKTGVVVLTTTDVAEGTNLYWTQARFTEAFASAIAGTASTALSDGDTIVKTTDTIVINCGNAS